MIDQYELLTLKETVEMALGDYDPIVAIEAIAETFEIDLVEYYA